MEIYKIGYRLNDVYTSYLDMGKPNQLNKQQVEQLKKQNNGSPVETQQIEVKSGGSFSKEFNIRENDVIEVNLIKQ
jgi:xylan 1,4-beta-xylosidase